MSVLLDTHAWLWFLLGDPRLGSTAKARIEDPEALKLVSPASYWELAIKISMGKYSLPEPFEDFFRDAIAFAGFELLPVEFGHAAVLSALPFHHRDPFDRMLIAQAVSEGVPIVSADAVFDAYGVARLW